MKILTHNELGLSFGCLTLHIIIEKYIQKPECYRGQSEHSNKTYLYSCHPQKQKRRDVGLLQVNMLLIINMLLIMLQQILPLLPTDYALLINNHTFQKP